MATPTRFGPLTLALEPLARRRGWQLRFERKAGPAPASVELPAALGSRCTLAGVTGAASKQSGNMVRIDPRAPSWSATWKL